MIEYDIKRTWRKSKGNVQRRISAIEKKRRMDEWYLIRDRKMDGKTYTALAKEFGIVGGA